MYNDPRAKDLLAQYPRQLAEGGEINAQVIVHGPDGKVYANPGDARQDGVFKDYGPAGATPAAPAQSWQAPAVQQRKTSLTPIYAPDQLPAGFTGKYIDPTVLSASQQNARDRAAQDAMIRSSLKQTGLESFGGSDYRQLQKAVRRGDITTENIKKEFVDPALEARVKKAYEAIGRTGYVMPELALPAKGGATADTYKNVTQGEYDYWANQLKEGKISGADFQKAFLTKAATDVPTTDLEAQRVYINNARKALGLPEIEKATKKNSNPYIGASTGNYNNMAAIGNLNTVKKPTTPTELAPIPLGPVSTQLFARGGEVGHPNEYADTVARWGRKGQEGFAEMIGLGDEVKYANAIPEFYFPKDEQLDGRGDAMRHMLLQAQIQKKLGNTPAEIASYIHENWLTGGQSKEEEEMDVANDALGRDIGARSTDKADLTWKALQAVMSGKAKTIAKKTKK
jgi:hypothetical protein